jgi:hypothetical protein
MLASEISFAARTIDFGKVTAAKIFCNAFRSCRAFGAELQNSLPCIAVLRIARAENITNSTLGPRYPPSFLQAAIPREDALNR